MILKNKVIAARLSNEQIFHFNLFNKSIDCIQYIVHIQKERIFDGQQRTNIHIKESRTTVI